MAEPVDITDVVMYFIRLSVFFITIFLLLTMVSDLQTTIANGQLQRASIQLSQNYMTSYLTVSTSIFNATALKLIDTTTTEPARMCSYPTYTEFSTLENGFRKRIAGFGYREPNGGGASQEHPIWLRFDERLVPGVMTMRIWYEGAELNDGSPYYTGLTGLMCAIERAWVYKAPQKEVELDCPFDPCVIYTDVELGNVCFADRDPYDRRIATCRYMPGINVTDDMGRPRYVSTGKHKLSAVPIKQNGILACDSPDITKLPTDVVGTVLLCDIVA